MKSCLRLLGLFRSLGGKGSSSRPSAETNAPLDPFVDDSAPTPGCRWNFLALRGVEYQLSPSSFGAQARLQIRRPRFISHGRQP